MVEQVPQILASEILPIDLDVELRENLLHAEAAATAKAHRSDWTHFQTWCRDRGLQDLPAKPETVAAYISSMAQEEFSISTITRRLASISVAHRLSKLESPSGSEWVRKTLRGIKHRYGSVKKKKSAFRVTHLRQIRGVLSEGPKGVRDLAILLVGYCGAFRRSELVSLDVEDIEFVPQGMRITLRRSKTDQAGVGRVLDISYASNKGLCPVLSLKDWLESGQITAGPIFRGVNRHGQVSSSRLNDRAVAEVLKEIAAAIGLDPEKIGGHSLRAGFVTDALAAGLPTPVIRRFSGHKSDSMLAEYYREASLFSVNVTSALGL